MCRCWYRPGLTVPIGGVEWIGKLAWLPPQDIVDELMNADLARTVMERIEALGQISEEPDRLTRTFCSAAMRRANDLVGSWMREAGMEVREDAIGNLIGHYPAASLESAREPGAKVLLLGSHLDTVRNAGKFDGALGVLVAIACVQRLFHNQIRLPFAIEVLGFADEEGVRYHSTYLGSKVLAGTFDPEDVKITDAEGVTMAQAIRSFGGHPDALASAKLERRHLLGYLEVHIEQGPVLEEKKFSVGVVSAIAGQTRIRVRFLGRAGHAGTVPMNRRRDALCAAAQFVLAVENHARRSAGLVATVGEIAALPGSSNVIPGEVNLSVDVRHSDDATRAAACAKLRDHAKDIGEARSVDVKWHVIHKMRSVACDRGLSEMLNQLVKRRQRESIFLPSGAGHDAAAMAALTPVAMLFVRCKGGISHHPDESVRVGDVRVAIAVMEDFLQTLARCDA